MARILVVDRTLSVREALAFVLELEGHHVAQAGTGGQALAALAVAPFDAVVVDADLRDMPFADFCAALRERFADARVVVMSLRATAEHSIASCAPSAFLAKPFTPPALFDALAPAA